MTITIEEDSFTHSQLLIDRVIFKTFAHHPCNFVITDRLRSLFTCKLSRMGRTMHKLGGSGRESQIKTWKESKWELNLHPPEIVPKTRKRKAENILSQSQVKKIAQLQKDLKSYEQTLKETNLQLRKAEEANKKTCSLVWTSCI